MDNQRCPGCFSIIEEHAVCSCGYDVESASPIALPPLSLLNGQYLVGRVLGKPGGFGITYLGWDTRLETLVAIKEYMPRDLAGRAADHVTLFPHSREENEPFRFGLEKFLEEARTLARFDHPNIVRVRSFFEENQTAYLVMDYLKGKNIAEYVEQSGGIVSENEAFRIMLPVLDGLREVHSKGVLHRDIKPQNIYLTESGRPILLDFGAARQAMSDRSRSISVILTQGFAPYEQYHRKGQQGPWTDIYACAATIYYMVTGQVPTDVLERVAEDNLQPPHEINAAISPQVSEIIMQALSINPADRPQDVFLFLDMLGIENRSPHIVAKAEPTSITIKEVNQLSANKNISPKSSVGVKTTLLEEKSGSGQDGLAVRPNMEIIKKSGVGMNTKRWIAIAAVFILVCAIGFAFSQYNSTGTIAFADGRKYVGDVRWGKATGKGIMTYPDGRQLNGQFQDGVPSGSGILILAGGYQYEGATNNGKRHGTGKLFGPKQEKVYDGQWENDMRSGTGTALMQDGSQYTGEFSNDKREGKGKLIDKNGQPLYEGHWKDDQRTGFGQIWYADRSRYEGQVKEGLRQGRGKQFNSNGKIIYEGDWVNDLRHGQGIMVAADGSSVIGTWNYGSYVEPRVVQSPAPSPRQDSQNSNTTGPQQRETQSPPQKRDASNTVRKSGDPTPQEVFGAFIDIINKIEKR